MPLIAITRPVSQNINDCELSFHSRQPIDLCKAIAQHADYQNCLSALGLEMVSLSPEPDLPDAVFVEDPAVVVDEVAVIPIMGALSRRPETDSVAYALSRYRPIKRLITPATLEGGDVMRVGRRIFVGLTQRTNPEGFRQLRETLCDYGYQVESVAVNGCLHLKSACSYIGNNSILINRALVDSKAFQDLQLIDVAEGEDAGANALVIGDVVIMPASFPKTRALLERRGFRLQTLDLSELQKAEAGVTCTSLIFNGVTTMPSKLQSRKGDLKSRTKNKAVI